MKNNKFFDKYDNQIANLCRNMITVNNKDAKVNIKKLVSASTLSMNAKISNKKRNNNRYP